MSSTYKYIIKNSISLQDVQDFICRCADSGGWKLHTFTISRPIVDETNNLYIAIMELIDD